MITLYPLKYNEFNSYYKSLNFILNESTLTLYISGYFANQDIYNHIQLTKNDLIFAKTVVNSVTMLYTYLLVDLNNFTYASDTKSFNSNEPHKPEFLIYFDSYTNAINPSITTQIYLRYSDTANYSLTSALSYTSLLSLTSNTAIISLTGIYSLTSELSYTSLFSLTSINSLTAITLNGYIASQTPQANQIPILDNNANLILPNTSLIQTNTYTIRRVDLTNATSDYMLAVGEEAIYFWDTTKSKELPLHIATNEGVYQMITIAPYQTSSDITLTLNPNNTTYSNAFIYSHVGWADGNTSAGGTSNTYSYFYFHHAASGGFNEYFFTTYKNSKFNIFIQRIVRNSIGGGGVHIGGSRWNDTTTSWTSLGTLTTSAANGTIIVLVRRLV